MGGVVLLEWDRYKLISELKIGDRVCSFPGNRVSESKCVIVSNIFGKIEMCRLKNDCLITFEHPVLIGVDDEKDYEGLDDALHSECISEYNLEWVFPKHAFNVEYMFQERIYNFVLDANHTMNVNGNWCCTLGHDLKGDVIEHEFWGNSKRINQFLKDNCSTYPYCVFDIN